MILFNNVTATYSPEVGIYDLSFHIQRGEMVFLMGPTGAGKSTIMRAIYRDIPIRKGKLLIDGEDITPFRHRRIALLRRRIGTIFQDYKLLPDRNVFENIALPLRINGTSRKALRSMVMDIAQRMGLEELMKARPADISGGEQQRVCIARALVKQPDIILADEPTGNLDIITSDEILDVFEYATGQGATVLMATHNFPLIRPRKKRFLELEEGRLIET